MSGTRAVLVFWAFSGTLAWNADWLSDRGDPQRSGWQRRERALNPDTVKNLRLLWKRKLQSPSTSLTAPTMLGRVVTHRGTAELVFVAGSTAVYAVDGDFGTLFWKRDLEGASSATPVLAPPAAGFDEDEDDDAPQPLRPLYVMAKDGNLHALNPGDGRDLSTWKFLTPGVKRSGLNFAAGIVYATAQDGIWSIDVSGPGTKPSLVHSRVHTLGGVTIGVDGSVLPAESATVAFSWKGKSVTAGVTRMGLLAVRTREQAIGELPGFRGALATSEDATGARWIFAVSAASQGPIAGFRLEEKDGRPALTRVWNSHSFTRSFAPVVAGNVVFVLSEGPSKGAILHALDAATGRELYSSGAAVTSPATGELAVANGHLCFTTTDGTLYCFGFPVDI
jgi:outer membrane protein assembly factor BamB